MVTGEFVQIEREGSTMPAYVARPENANETTPTVVMAMHLWGVDREQRATADRFATEGFATIVPDLYARFGAPNGDEVDDYSVMMPFARRLEFATVDPDIRAAAA